MASILERWLMFFEKLYKPMINKKILKTIILNYRKNQSVFVAFYIIFNKTFQKRHTNIVLHDVMMSYNNIVRNN